MGAEPVFTKAPAFSRSGLKALKLKRFDLSNNQPGFWIQQPLGAKKACYENFPAVPPRQEREQSPSRFYKREPDACSHPMFDFQNRRGDIRVSAERGLFKA